MPRRNGKIRAGSVMKCTTPSQEAEAVQSRPRRSLLVSDVSKVACRYLIEKHHYAHKWKSKRMPGIKYSWGLYMGNRLVGCVIFSIPASYTLCEGVCGRRFKRYVLELSRLVVVVRTKNAASLLIGHSLRYLPDAIVVSYADCNEHVGHVGYVYQATNWLYTGHGNAEPIWVDPRDGSIVSYTRRHIDQKARTIGLEWTDLEKRKQVGKHRYVTFTGSRRFKKIARAALRYKVLPYPKGETRRH